MIIETVYEMRRRPGIIPVALWTSGGIYIFDMAGGIHIAIRKEDFAEWHNHFMSRCIYKMNNVKSLVYQTRFLLIEESAMSRVKSIKFMKSIYEDWSKI